jgi:zinc protease
MSTARSRVPVLAEPPALRLPPPTHHRLANGIEVLFVARRELPVVDVQFVVRAGAASDDAAHAGRAYLTADVLDQGTTSRSATRIADEAELLGASLHTHGSWDYSSVTLHVLTGRLQPALALLADVVTNPTFPADEFERKRAERLTAIMQEADEPRSIATNHFLRAVYAERHPYGLPLGGTRDTVERLTAADVGDFYRTRYAPANAFLVMVGDFDASATLPLLEQLFGNWTAPDHAVAGTVPPVTTAPRAVHIVDLPAAAQSELRVGCAGPARDTADYFPLLVANTVLGGAFTSRLNMKLREEKGYTYGAGSSFSMRRGGGPFLASTAVATAATADAISDMVREIGRMAHEPVGADELERAKNYIVLGLPRMFETTSDIADHLSELSLHRLGDDYYNEYATHVRAVTAADIQAAAARWLRGDRLVITIAGAAAAIASDVEALGIGTVNVRADA